MTNEHYVIAKPAEVMHKGGATRQQRAAYGCMLRNRVINANMGWFCELGKLLIRLKGVLVC
jgi:hypothetical protein